MPKHILSAAVVSALSLSSVAAEAATLRLDATPILPENFSDFSIEFEDRDGDGLFSTDELLAFSGLTKFTSGDFFDGIFRFADIPGIADGGEQFLAFSGPNFLGTSIHPSLFEYALVELEAEPPTPIPAPATVWLFASALVGLGFLRRRAGRARPRAA